jgi:hypothetical protein
MPTFNHKSLLIQYKCEEQLFGDRLARKMNEWLPGLGVHVDHLGVWWTDNDDLLETALQRGGSADIIRDLAVRMARGRKAAQNPQSVIDFTDHIPREPSFTITEVAAISGRGTRCLFEREPHEGTKVAEIGLYQVQTTTGRGRTEDHYYLVGGERDDLLVHKIDEGEGLRLATRLGAGEPHHEVFRVYRDEDYQIRWTTEVRTGDPVTRAEGQIKTILDALSVEDRARVVARITDAEAQP